MPRGNMDHIAVRLDDETLERIDVIQAEMSRKTQVYGIKLTQSDAVRAAIVAGLAVLEKQHGLPVRQGPIDRPPPRRGRPPGKPRRR